MDPVIKQTEEKLERLSSDEEAKRMYEFRENSRIERNSLIMSGKMEGEREGILKGRQEGIREVVQHMLAKGLKLEEVADFTGLSVDEIRKL